MTSNNSTSAPCTTGDTDSTPAVGVNWLRRLFVECLNFRPLVVAIVIVSFVTIAFVVGGPLLTRLGVNRAVDGDTAGLWLLGGGLVLIAACDFAGDYLRRFIAGKLSLRVQHELRAKAFDAIGRLDGQGQDKLRAGQVVSRTNSDMQQIQTMLQMIPVPLAVATYYSLGTAVMLWLSPVLTLIVALVVASLGLTAWTTRRRVFKASAKAQHEAGQITEHIRSRVTGISVVKSFTQELRELGTLQNLAKSLFIRRLNTAKAQAVPGATMMGLPILGQVALLAVGGSMVLAGTLDFGTFVAFSLYLGMLTGPTRVLANFLVIAQRTRASMERVVEITDADPTMEDGSEDAPAEGGLTFENVSFGYTSDSPVLRNVSFAVAPGETVAVVGPSGSGTSTLGLLVPRFYDPLDGRILLGDPNAAADTDLRDIRLDSLRENIGMVFEEPFLFNGTIRDNVTYGHDVVPAEDEVIAAVTRAGAMDFISALPGGLDAPVREGGSNLSGGQRQRIALARALLSAPGVLVIDDATSSVDASTEASINQALADLLGQADSRRATLLIARRHSTLALADRIVVLDRGEVVANGTWSELEQSSQHFRALIDGEPAHSNHPDEEDSTPADDVAHAPGDISELDDEWIGLARGMDDAAVSTRSRTVLSLARPAAPIFAAALILVAISTAAGSIIPIMIQQGVDKGIAADSESTILVFAAIAAALVLADWIANSTQQRISARASESVQYGVRVRSFQHVLGMPLSYFERERGGQILTRLTVDVDSLARFLQTGLAGSVVALSSMAGFAIAMIVLSPMLALVTFSPLPFVVLATFAFRRLSSRAYEKSRDNIEQVNSTLQENIAGLKTVQVHGRQASAREMFRTFSNRYRVSREAAQRYIALYFPFLVFCGQLSGALVMVVGAHLVAGGSLSAGTLAAFLLMQPQFFAPIQQLANIFDSFQQAVVGARRTNDLLAQPSNDVDWDDRVPARPSTVTALPTTIDLHEATYLHEGADTPAVRNVSLSLRRGESIGIVGTTGAGKTTLVKVIAGLYPTTSGRLVVDGGHVADTEALRSYRRRVGLVPQEPTLLEGTVADNIRYGNPTVGDAGVRAAAKAAGAHESIMALRENYAHQVSSAGANLSAGQRQLIALARAYLSGADLLLLDETTSHLDQRSESAVMAATRDSDRTALVVAHRLTTAAACDRIAVMERGELVEVGTHAELVARENGAYASLWSKS